MILAPFSPNLQSQSAGVRRPSAAFGLKLGLGLRLGRKATDPRHALEKTIIP
jgi:hypothetical protein